MAATTGEMLAARRGLGFLLSDAASQFDMTSLYAALFILMLLGLWVAELACAGASGTMLRVAAMHAGHVADPPDAEKISLAGVGKRFVTRDREIEALQPIDLDIRARMNSSRWSGRAAAASRPS